MHAFVQAVANSSGAVHVELVPGNTLKSEQGWELAAVVVVLLLLLLLYHEVFCRRKRCPPSPLVCTGLSAGDRINHH